MSNEEKKASTPEPTPEPKLRVSMEGAKEQAKRFTSASSASFHRGLSQGFKKLKKVGSIVLEKAADYAQKRKEEKGSK